MIKPTLARLARLDYCSLIDLYWTSMRVRFGMKVRIKTCRAAWACPILFSTSDSPLGNFRFWVRPFHLFLPLFLTWFPSLPFYGWSHCPFPPLGPSLSLSLIFRNCWFWFQFHQISNFFAVLESVLKSDIYDSNSDSNKKQNHINSYAHVIVRLGLERLRRDGRATCRDLFSCPAILHGEIVLSGATICVTANLIIRRYLVRSVIKRELVRYRWKNLFGWGFLMPEWRRM